MAIPTQKRTKSSKRRRSVCFLLKKIKLAICPKCKKPVLPHHACSFCGTYADKEILKIKPKKKIKKKVKEKK